ncbi:MAG: peptide deformylase [Clostridiaceae bacterium]|jgi:peptide deformylase|nr:peptide deformylase [Clostridiaceae bacterium]
MAKRIILKEGDPTLNRKARPVNRFDERLKTLVEDMFETMYDDEGVGLAAPQVGVLRRLFVMDVGDENGALVFINPSILNREGEQEGTEGCLSIPGLYGIVKRPMDVLVSAQDENGIPFEIRLTGLGARCACHECDHLDGVLFRRRSETPLTTLEELSKYTDVPQDDDQLEDHHAIEMGEEPSEIHTEMSVGILPEASSEMPVEENT